MAPWEQQLSFCAEEEPEPILCWLWLARVLGPGCMHAGRVLDAFADAAEAWEARTSPLFARAAGSAAAARALDPDLTPESCRPMLRRCEKQKIQIICYDDPDYPLPFTRIPDMPPVLFCTGDAGWLNSGARVGMIGSRTPTPYGVSAAAAIGQDLARAGAVIVSGLAYGLDSESHKAALERGAPTIGVQGVPIDKVYPASNRKLRDRIEENGCVISEYGPGEPSVGRNGFLQRNRLIAALSDALLVVEAKEKSGTMSTVAHAERYGKPIFAVPGSIFAPSSGGTNQLLRSGRAQAAVCAADMADALGLYHAPAKRNAPAQPEPQRRAPENETARRVLACLGPEPRELDQLREQSGLPSGTLLAALMELTLGGWIFELPGGRYVLK